MQKLQVESNPEKAWCSKDFLIKYMKAPVLRIRTRIWQDEFRIHVKVYGTQSRSGEEGGPLVLLDICKIGSLSPANYFENQMTSSRIIEGLETIRRT